MIKLGSTIAIDLGTSSVKVVKGKAGDKGIFVDAYTYIKLPADYKGFDSISQKEAVIRLMRPALRKAGIKGGQCILSISTSDIISRPMVLPDMPEQSLRENVTYELSQYVPIDLEKYVVDYKAIKDDEDESKGRLYIIAAALPKSLLQDAVALLQKLNMKVRAIDLDFNALTRFFSFIDKRKDLENSDNMIIDIGHEFTQVIVYNKNKIYISRIINHGSNDINLLIANALGKNPEDIALMKYTIGENTPPEVYGAVAGVFENIVTDIIRIIDYFNARYRGRSIKNIYLSGGGVAIGGINEYLSQALGMPVLVLKPDDWIKCRKNNIKDDWDISTFTTALGLLLKEK